MSFEFPGKGSVRQLADVRTYDLFLAVGAAIGILILSTVVDVILHDNIVRPFLDACNSNPPPEQCARDSFSLSLNSKFGEVDLVKQGQSYWAILNLIEFAFAFLVGLVRGIVGKSLGVGAIYFFTIYIPMVTGFEDYLYYVMMDRPLPQTLPWINGMVLMMPVNALLNHGADVALLTLYESMTIYATILGAAWYLALRD